MTDIDKIDISERSLDQIPNFPQRDEPIGFMLRLAKALHTYGVPAYELENMITTIAAQMDYGVQCLSMPTSITMTFSQDDEPVQTFVIRVAPGEINIDKLRRTTMVAHRVLNDDITPQQGAHELREITSDQASFPAWVTILFFGIVSACIARIFSGGINEIAPAFAIGIFVGALTISSDSYNPLANVLPLIAAFVASVFAFAAANYITPMSIYVVIASGIIVLLPGLMLTVAMAELSTQNLVSGTARLFGAGAIFIQMAFGVAIGKQLGELFGTAVNADFVSPLPFWTLVVALVLVGFSFVFLFRARLRDTPWMILSAMLAYTISYLLSLYAGPVVGAFVGSLFIGILAKLLNMTIGLPGSVVMLPGFIILVPGSVGFKSLTALLEHDVIGGLETAFNMVLVGIALVTGFLISSLTALPKPKKVKEPD